jgi:hypothetical protein
MKKFFNFLFRGLLSNQEIIDNHKEHSLLSSLIILIVSLLIAVVPSFSSIAKTKGSSVITSSQNASLDTSLVLFSQYIDENNISLGIKDGKFYIDSADKEKYFPNGEYSIVAQERELLAVRICEDANIEAFQTMYAYGRTSLDQTDYNLKPRSYLIISESYFVLATYLSTATNTLNDDGTLSSAASTNATYSGLCSSSKDVEISSFYTLKNYDSCISNWETLFNNLYQKSKVRYLWSYTGIISAINVAAVLLIALMLMILSRLKKSSLNKFNFLDSFKIISYASLSPAIIALCLGFIMSAVAGIAFVLCIGIRGTYLSMKASAGPAQGQ